MKKRFFYLCFTFALGILLYSGCRQKGSSVDHTTKNIEIRGIYGSPDAFWKKNTRLNDLGVNAIFLSKSAITAAMIERAGEEGLRVFAEFPLLNGEDYVDNHPEAWAIDSSGNKVSKASWFMGVCPTEPGFRLHRMTELKELLGKFDIAGVWLDYVHWHAQFEEPEPILPETCFCSSCLSTFTAATGIEVQGKDIPEKAKWILSEREKEWRDWRCAVIADWVKDCKLIIDNVNKNCLLGIYHCPWNDTEYDGARRRILGLDYEMLKNTADVFSPMVYHGRMGREPLWVKENIEWFSEKISEKEDSIPKIWPIVQAYDDPYTISPGEFESVLRYGMSGKATGIMMFTSNAVAENDAKTEILSKVYKEISK